MPNLLSKLVRPASTGASLVAFIALMPLVSQLASAQGAPDAEQTVSVIPQPESLTVSRGTFALSAATVIWADAASADIARRFAASLAPATGLTIPVRVGTSATGIVFTRDARL